MRWLLILVLCAGTAHAHQSSIKYVDVAVQGSLGRINVTVHPSDLTEPMHLPTDAQPTAAQAMADANVAPFVAKWLAFSQDDKPCLASSARTRLDPEKRFVVVKWEISCVDEIAALRVDFAGFFAVDQAHEAILTVHAAGDVGDPTVVRASAPVIVMRAGESQSLLAWVGLGMHHIYSGKDHISFVLALLLVVMLAPDGRIRSGAETARRTAAIVTAFTVAHSLSLIAASLGWVSLPSRFVESAIAASIVYTAIENLIVPATRWRFLLAFGFGLVHGLGFASAPADLLPPTHVIPPLLGFNVGVELGQLTIVLVALPLFYAASRCTGFARYRRVVMPVLSSVILLFGLNWLISRAFAIPPILPWMDM